MKLKFIAVTIILSALLIPTIQSCKKYPDGPTISLRSRAERVANTWKVENYKINGNDYTSLVSSYTETYTKQGAYSYSWGILDGTGTWSFQNKDTEIKLNGSDGQASRKLTILKLEEKSFWYSYIEGNDKHELHLIGN
ncbi:MAG: hypothetical protein Q7W45_09665 [Bacteroidota bacterium]|nr:hypothetical protein [Bacteroidota bacterium]MDP3144053.1 hypothetical protein [Bacteroidota bacterium]